MGDYVREHYLELANLKKEYATARGPFTVLENFNLNVALGEFVCLIGHSGCGKSTILSMVAGLVEPTGGSIILADHELDGPGPDRGVVFQAPCLLPWLSAYDNVMLGVNQVYQHATRAQRAQIGRYYLNRVGLGQSMHLKPAELSGGMRQRVGIARAFALSPKMLLLDEPFGMLDSLTRYELQDVLVDLLEKDRKSTLMVTHDVDEALFLSDRVVMMTTGPRAKVGEVLINTLPRPRRRETITEHPDYYVFRERLISFLASQDKAHAAPASPPPAGGPAVTVTTVPAAPPAVPAPPAHVVVANHPPKVALTAAATAQAEAEAIVGPRVA